MYGALSGDEGECGKSVLHTVETYTRDYCNQFNLTQASMEHGACSMENHE